MTVIELTDGDLSEPVALRRALAEILARGELKSHLEYLLSSNDALAAVRQQSYHHPNGFLKTVLSAERGAKLRLHSWPEGSSPLADSDVHDHRWDFASLVLEGAFHSDHFANLELKSDGSREAFEYHSPSGGTSFRLKGLGRASIDLDETVRHEAGTLYALDHNILHQVVDVSAPAITVVLQGPVRRTYTTVVTNQPRVSTALKRPTEDELRTALSKALTSL